MAAVNNKIVISANTSNFFRSHRLGLARFLRDRGYEVQIILPFENYNQETQIDGFPIHRVHLSRKGLNPLFDFRTIIDYYRLFLMIKPGVYHGFTIKPVIYGTIAAWLARVPKRVITVTGLGYVFTSDKKSSWFLQWLVLRMYQMCFMLCHHVVFQNSDDKSFYRPQSIKRSEIKDHTRYGC
ncbi:MAG: glycosyltransferase [Bdellovibrionales bacterium]